jgi:magnesium chelatase subunit D
MASVATGSADAHTLRLAAALLAVDPQGLGGVRVAAPAGPARDAWLACLQAWRERDSAWRRLPPQAGDDRLLGGLDLPATLAAGRPVLQPGLLAECDGGFVIVPMAERLPAGTAAVLASVLDNGQLRVERDGIAQVLASRVAVVALDEALPEDAPLAPALAARLGLWIDLTALPPSALGLPDDSTDWLGSVVAARARLAKVQAAAGLVDALCATALALGVHDSRAALFALHAARASAALFGRTCTNADDAALAARLVLAPRATQLPAPDEGAEAEPPPPAPQETADPADATAPQPPADEVQTLEDQVQAAALAAVPAGLLARLMAGDALQRRGAAGGGCAG